VRRRKSPPSVRGQQRKSRAYQRSEADDSILHPHARPLSGLERVCSNPFLGLGRPPCPRARPCAQVRCGPLQTAKRSLKPNAGFPCCLASLPAQAPTLSKCSLALDSSERAEPARPGGPRGSREVPYPIARTRRPLTASVAPGKASSASIVRSAWRANFRPLAGFTAKVRFPARPQWRLPTLSGRWRPAHRPHSRLPEERREPVAYADAIVAVAGEVGS
jgi:hypothetical protein